MISNCFVVLTQSGVVTVRQHVLSGDGAGGRGRPLRASAAAARQGPGREGHPEAESPGRRGAAVPSPSRRRSQVCTNYTYSNTIGKERTKASLFYLVMTRLTFDK